MHGINLKSKSIKLHEKTCIGFCTVNKISIAAVKVPHVLALSLSESTTVQPVEVMTLSIWPSTCRSSIEFLCSLEFTKAAHMCVLVVSSHKTWVLHRSH